MSNSETKQQVVDYLKGHGAMTLATVTPDGVPLAHTVKYASDGATIYFVTMKSTRKAVDIEANPRVALTVDEDYADWMAIKGVQLEAAATILRDPADIEKAAGVYIGKYPFVADFPPNPEMVFVKVEPTRGFFLDYAKGFAHRDTVAF